MSEYPAPVVGQNDAYKRSQNEVLFNTREAVMKEAGEDNNALEHSVNVRLNNPLLGLSYDTIVSDVDEFATSKGLEAYREDLLKGALVAQAQSNGNLDSVTILTEEERQILEHERTHRWSQPFKLYWLACCCSVAAAVQGADEAVVNGALLFFPQQFGIGSGSDHDTWLVGLVAAAPYIGCAFLGCWLTQPLNAVFGRRGTIFITSFVSFASCIWQACTNSWEHMFVARLVLGLGIGPKSATVPMYAAECTPPAIRGALTMQWQTWTAFGIMLGYAADLALYNVKYRVPHITGLNWRLMMGSAAIPAIFVMAQVYFCPESPRWLMKKNRYPEAMQSFLSLRQSRLQAARDLYFAHRLLLEEERLRRSRSVFPFTELFTVPRNRRATIGATIVMFGQQFCGVNVIAYYSSTIIKTVAQTSDINALLGSWGFGMLNFLFAIPAWYTIDTFGRRNLLLVTLPFMAMFLLLTGFAFWVPVHGYLNSMGEYIVTDGHARLAVVLTGIYVYACLYSPGFGPVPFTYSAESFPLYIREIGMTYATVVLWFFNSVLAVTFPRMLTAFKAQGAFGFYAGWCLILWVLVFFLLPETKALSLEELDIVFSVPTKKHASFQLRNAFNNFRRTILRQNVPKEQLYTLDDSMKTSPTHAQPYNATKTFA